MCFICLIDNTCFIKCVAGGIINILANQDKVVNISGESKQTVTPAEQKNQERELEAERNVVHESDFT